jgi:hypothetical protein
MTLNVQKTHSGSWRIALVTSKNELFENRAPSKLNAKYPDIGWNLRSASDPLHIPQLQCSNG